MDFALSDAQTEVRDLAMRILSERLDNDRHREIEKQDYRFDEALWATLAEAGLLGVAIDEKHGGMGFDFETLCLLATAAGAAAAPLPIVPTLADAALPIGKFGSEAQRKSLLGGVVKGETLLAAAWSEPGNTELTKPGAEAKAKGDGYVLDGVKQCVPYADRSERILLAAKDGEGVVLLLVAPKAKGVKLEAQTVTNGEPQFMMTMKGVKVGAEDVLVSGADAATALDWCLQRSAAALCALGLGVGEKMLEMTAIYTAEREQFGVPIGTFQAVAHRAANCFIDLQCLRLTTQHAVSRLSIEEEAASEVQVAKIWLGDALHRISYASQHLHGGVGVDRDYGLFRYCLWAKHVELSLGCGSDMLARLGDQMAEEAIAAAG